MSLAEEFSDKIILLLDGKNIFSGDLKEILITSKEKSLEDAITHLVDNNCNV